MTVRMQLEENIAHIGPKYKGEKIHTLLSKL